MTDRNTDVKNVWAIDVHSHVGNGHGQFEMDIVENGKEEYLLQTMQKARIGISINSSRYAVMPRGSGYSFEGNLQMLQTAHTYSGVYAWVTVDPKEPETFAQAEQVITDPKVLGIKIHPEEHEYDLDEYGDQIFSLAQRLRVPVLGHSGAACCMPEIYGKYADKYPEILVIAAHLGSSFDGDPTHHIRAIWNSRNKNLYTDTSSAMSLMSGLLEYAVGEIGSDHILFGTDSGNYFSPCQRIRIDEADIRQEDKRKILRENACRLFPKLGMLQESAE